MSLTAGTRLGPYEILSLLGSGGMGEVYRARDTKLNRDVALKFLPDSFANDPDRLARFQREAQILASLNHPNIAHIHGLEESGGVRALVMELVEGEDLARRIARGAIPIDEVLPIAKQLADALEAAHEQGIIHRDLKPANIKVREDGTVNVLDFGLAKAMEPVGSPPNVTQSPTITTPAMMTGVGTILGTAAYMSPEQARGRAADRRADIWSFGVIVFEMLSGARAFDGETVSDVLAMVIEREPDWTKLPASMPPRLRAMVRRCLRKDARLRLQAIGDARIELHDIADGRDTDDQPAETRKGNVSQARVRWVAGALVALVAVTGAAVGALLRAPTPASGLTSRFNIARRRLARVEHSEHPGKFRCFDAAVDPPDGRRIAFVARSADGRRRSGCGRSTRSKRLCYRARTGPSRHSGPRIHDSSGSPPTASSRKSTAQAVRRSPFATSARFAARRGMPPMSSCLRLKPTDFSACRPAAARLWNSLRHNPARSTTRGRCSCPTAVTFSFAPCRPATRSWPPSMPPVVRSSCRSPIRPSCTDDHILFLRERIDGAAIDPRGARTAGDAVPIAENVATQNPAGTRNSVGGFAASANGDVGFLTAGAASLFRLVWFNRAGERIGTLADPALFQSIALSHDGKRAAVQAVDLAQRSTNVWIVDLEHGGRSPLTFNPVESSSPVWSPDDTRIIYRSRKGASGDLYERASDGTGVERLVLGSDTEKAPWAVSHDGRWLLFQVRSPKTGNDLWRLPLGGGDAKPSPFAATGFTETLAQVSPDSRWVAYSSNDSGQFQVYVAAFTDATGKRMISQTGGRGPRWRADGRELFYIDRDNNLVAVDVKSVGNAFEFGVPHALFKSAITDVAPFYFYDVAPNGQRFVMIVPENDAKLDQPITVVLNWAEELKQRVPTK